jgi:hypothetical protein
MTKHIDAAIEDFPEVIEQSSPTPHEDNLFRVRDSKDTNYLDEEQSHMLHHTVAQLLFIGTRVRRDIQTAVAFLTTRVKKPDNDDWGRSRGSSNT